MPNINLEPTGNTFSTTCLLNCLTISPDGSMFAFSRYGDKMVEVASASSWCPLQEVRNAFCNSEITQIEWTENNILATLAVDNTILLYPRTPIGCKTHAVFDTDHPDFVEADMYGSIVSLRFNPLGDHFVISTDLSEMVVFKEMENKSLSGHRGWIQTKNYTLSQSVFYIDYDPLNTFIAAAGYKRTLYFLYFEKEDPIIQEFIYDATVKDQLLEEEIYGIALAPSGSEICVSMTYSFVFFDVHAFEITRVVRSQSHPCQSLRYIREDLVIAGGYTRTLSVLLDKCLYKPDKSLTIKSRPVLVVRVFPCSTRLLVAGGGGLIEEWRLDSGNPKSRANWYA